MWPQSNKKRIEKELKKTEKREIKVQRENGNKSPKKLYVT